MPVETIVVGALCSIAAVLISGKLERRSHEKRLYVYLFTFAGLFWYLDVSLLFRILALRTCALPKS